MPHLRFKPMNTRPFAGPQRWEFRLHYFTERQPLQTGKKMSKCARRQRGLVVSSVFFFLIFPHDSNDEQNVRFNLNALSVMVTLPLSRQINCRRQKLFLRRWLSDLTLRLAKAGVSPHSDQSQRPPPFRESPPLQRLAKTTFRVHFRTLARETPPVKVAQ